MGLEQISRDTRVAEIDRLKRALEERLDEDRKIQVSLADYEEVPEILAYAHLAASEELDREEKEISESLDEALSRFWETNIKPQFPTRENNILSEKMIECLTNRRPETEQKWFAAVPMELRQAMNPKQKPFLEDILYVIAEYV